MIEVDSYTGPGGIYCSPVRLGSISRMIDQPEKSKVLQRILVCIHSLGLQYRLLSGPHEFADN